MASRSLTPEETEYCRDVKSKIPDVETLVKAMTAAKSVQSQNAALASLRANFDSKLEDDAESRSALFNHLGSGNTTQDPALKYFVWSQSYVGFLYRSEDRNGLAIIFKRKIPWASVISKPGCSEFTVLIRYQCYQNPYKKFPSSALFNK